MAEEELRKIAPRKIAEAIMKVRRGELSIAPGFDGEFGKIKIRQAEPLLVMLHYLLRQLPVAMASRNGKLPPGGFFICFRRTL